MTQVIALCAGPCCGKSVVASGVFSRLKQAGINCELVTEVAKDIVYEETHKLLENQIHVFSEQFRRQYRINKKVDFIITDCPLMLNSIYFDYHLKKFGSFFTPEYQNLAREFFDSSFDQFDNIVYVLERKGEYNISGRNQTLDEAMVIDREVIKKLNDRGQSYTILSSTVEQNIDIIVNNVLSRKNNGTVYKSNELRQESGLY